MAPYICHIHSGLYISDADREGCQSEYCVGLRKLVLDDSMNIVGFGGSDAQKLSRYDSKVFHKDMYAYKAAVEQGADPEMVTAKAAESALRQAEEG